MCVGSFEGVVKKVVKRERPRKHHPGHEERVDKAQRTQTKNKNAAAAATAAAASNPSSEAPSLASEYSESSNGLSPPQADYDVLDAPPFADYANGPYVPADPFVGANMVPELEYAMQPVAAVAETQCISPQAIQNDVPLSRAVCYC